MLMGLQAAPKVNLWAWFALAVAAPLALLALGAAATQAGAPRTAGIAAAVLLAPAIVLALRSLERRQGPQTAAQAREQDLVRAFCLTTGQACGFLFVVAAGAPFSGESVAVGLFMAGVPLALGVAGDLWHRLIDPINARLTPPVRAEAPASHWSLEWSEPDQRRMRETPGRVVSLTELQAAARPPPPPRPLSGRPRPEPRVKLRVSPAPVDEAWMQRSFARPEGRPPLSSDRRQYGSGWISGPTAPQRAVGMNGGTRLQ
jgi:hypothetical protein